MLGSQRCLWVMSRDGVRFRVSENAASMCGIFRQMTDACGFDSWNGEDDQGQPPDEQLPTVGVDSSDLAKVLSFCNYHMERPLPALPKPLRDNTLVNVDDFYITLVGEVAEERMRLLRAADFMDVQPLVDLCSAVVAQVLRGASLDEIRKFNSVK